MKKKQVKESNIIPFPQPAKRPVYLDNHPLAGMQIPTLDEVSKTAKEAASRWK